MLKAKPDCCEECAMGAPIYIPCNKPATVIVKTRDATPYRMCEHCADHNVRNRGAKIIGPYQPASTRVKLDDLKPGDVITLDSGFTCHEAGNAQVESDTDGAYFICANGRHYLDGQEGADGYLVGITKAGAN